MPVTIYRPFHQNPDDIHDQMACFELIRRVEQSVWNEPFVARAGPLLTNDPTNESGYPKHYLPRRRTSIGWNNLTVARNSSSGKLDDSYDLQIVPQNPDDIHDRMACFELIRRVEQSVEPFVARLAPCMTNDSKNEEWL
ncbi:hypothetical protein CEXT_168271 [Caerostris extrusa]|uniref:Uncharacterized protein n=1 Tax=Caerostris extrusa TaxID=172846 RepID=A0AAV4QCN7_CAEEX|nr:hypothetical protein CEXT_168271 [Caerostris extrusa]